MNNNNIKKLNILRISDDKDLITNPKLLADYIKKHDAEINNKYAGLWRAYSCKADILDTNKIKAKALNKPDYRIAVNYPRYVVDTYNGFAAGIPIKISASDQAVTDYIAQIDAENDLDDVYAEIHTSKCVFGEAYQLLYVDERGEIATVASDPLEAFPIYNNSIKPHSRYFVRTYWDEDNKRHGTISDDTYVYYFDFDGADIVFTEQHPHGFGAVPAVIYTMNSARIGLIEIILPMCNAFDKAISEKMNDVDAFADAIMKVLGATLTKEQIADLRDKRIINIGGKDGSNVIVDFLARPSGDTTQEHLLERLERLIFTVSMVCNVSDDNFATSSGIALKMKMEPMSNLAASDWRQDQASLRNFWRLVCANPVSPLPTDAWQQIEFTHYLNYPDNVADSVDIAAKLNGLTSKRTQLSVLSSTIVPDIDAELKQIEDEQAEAIEALTSQVVTNTENTENTEAEVVTDGTEAEATE